MPLKNKVTEQFRPLKVSDDMVLVAGGYNRHPEPCPYRTAMCDGETLLFLKVEAREPWLIKGACGDKHLSGGLTGRTTLVRELREKLEQACDGDPKCQSDIRCRGEAAGSVVTDDDPMRKVAEDEVVEMRRVSAKLSNRRQRFFRNNCKNKIIEVSMSQRAPETGIEAGHRMVRLYCENRKRIWLCTKDADWALVYLRDQLTTKGWLVSLRATAGRGHPNRQSHLLSRGRCISRMSCTRSNTAAPKMNGVASSIGV